MKTQEEQNFWNYFEKVQGRILPAFKTDIDKLDRIVEKLENKLKKVNSGWSLSLAFGEPFCLMVLSVKGKDYQWYLAQCFMQNAPDLYTWKFELGIEPYKESPTPMKLHFAPYKMDVYANQVYVHIHKIYSSSNKLHLHVFVDLHKKGIPKSDLYNLISDFLFFYLGDRSYYDHISRIKVLRRRLTKTNFIPLSELKNLIQFKSVN